MNRQPSDEMRGICRIDAWAVADATGVRASPASLLIDVNRSIKVLAVDTPDKVDHHPAARGAKVCLRQSDVIIPGLVNAHTHLDLTHIGPQPHDPEEGFVPWVDRIRAQRHTDDEAIAASVRRGIELCVAGGTVAVGDIAGGMSLVPLRECRGAGLGGVSFLEFFAMGNREQAGIESLRRFVETHREEVSRDHAMKFGLQPHAPYSVSLAGYEAAIELAETHDWCVATHLAETPEERAFIGGAKGPKRELFERLGIWEDRILTHVGHGSTPVQHVAQVLERLARRLLAAHLNDVDDDGLATLAQAGVHVVYCPRASAYFGAEDQFGSHRYQDMKKAGVTVCLGTDSIVNLPPSSADPQAGGISVLDEMRYLCRRDGLDPATALGMGTTQGAAALGCAGGKKDFAIEKGAQPSGLVCVKVSPSGDALAAVMASDNPARLIVGRFLLNENDSCVRDRS